MKMYLSYIVFSCAIGLALPLQAQLQKGQAFLNGGLSFHNEEERNSLDRNRKGNVLTLSLGAGHLLSDKLALSFGVSFFEGKNSGFNEVFTPVQLQPNDKYLYEQALAETKDAYSTLALSIGINNYIPLRERLAMVLGSSLGVTFRSNESSQQIVGQSKFTSESNQTDYALRVSPGLLYFLSPRFALNGNFGGLSLTVTPKTEENGLSIISGGFTTEGILGIGLNYFFK